MAGPQQSGPRVCERGRYFHFKVERTMSADRRAGRSLLLARWIPIRPLTAMGVRLHRARPTQWLKPAY
jgi:hypothetical protein